MSAFFVKPENAFKRSEELLAVGRKAEALQVLVDVIASKRPRAWQKVYEDIMVKTLDVCVDMRRGKIVKDSLWQYKQMCQQANITSLEVVVRHLLNRAEQQAKEAQSLADAKALELVDLDDESDAAIVLSTVSGEDSKERADRQLLMPWLRFLWEMYRAVLEVLKNNSRLLSLYHDAASQAFTFCLRYKRRNEFRRLCDLLRLHVANAQRYSQQAAGAPLPAHLAELNSPEATQMQLETRLLQFDTAGTLEVWQEAYKSVEDIRALLARVRKAPQHAALGAFLAKLANLFWVSDYLLVHAYAVLQHYAHVASAPTPDAAEVAECATAVVLAALAVPVQLSRPEDLFEADAQRERTQRMSRLLGLPANAPALSRESLLSEIASRGIAARANENARQLLVVLEKTFDPLGVCSRAGAVLDGWLASQSPRLAQYATALRRLAVLRLLQQCARVYDVITVAEFGRLVRPAFQSFEDAEQYVLQLVQRRFVSLSVDQVAGTLIFRRDGAGADAAARGTLTGVFRSLTSVVSRIDPSVAQRRLEAKRAAFTAALKAMQSENATLLARADLIEKKKVQRELYEEWTRQRAEERRRLEDEQRRQEAMRAAQEAERVAAANAKSAAAAIANSAKVTTGISFMDALRGRDGPAAAAATSAPGSAYIAQTPAQIAAAQRLPVGATPTEAPRSKQPAAKPVEDPQRLNERMAKKIVELSRDADFTERARRLEELPLLVSAQDVQRKQDKERYDAQVKAYRESEEARHKAALEEKARLGRMSSDCREFAKRLMAAREAVYKVAHAEWEIAKAELDKKLEAERKIREERESKEREEREAREKVEAERRAAEQAAAEAARKKAEEEEARKKAEEARKQEELDRKRKEEAERKAAEEAERKTKAEEERTKRQEAIKKLEEEERSRSSRRDDPFGRRDDRPAPARDDFRRDDRPRDDQFSRRPDDRAPVRREDPFGRRPDDRDRWSRDAPRDAPRVEADRWSRDSRESDRWSRDPAPRDRDYDRPAPPRDRDYDRPAPPRDRDYDRPAPPRDRDYDRPAPPRDRDYDRPAPPRDRDYDRPAPPRDRDYDRPAPPRDRDYDRPAPPRDRDYDRPAPPRDRDYDRPAPPRDRDYDRPALSRDRDFDRDAPRREEPRPALRDDRPMSRDEPRRSVPAQAPARDEPRRSAPAPAGKAAPPPAAAPEAEDGFMTVASKKKKK